MCSSPTFDQEAAREWVVRAVAGEPGAYEQLVALLWPQLISMVGSSRMMVRGSDGSDHTRDVVTRIVDKFQRNHCHTLTLFDPWKQRHPDKSFEDWLHIVAANEVRDFVRGRKGTRARTASESPSIKQLMNEYASAMDVDDLGARPPVTAAQTARQMLEFAEQRLPTDQLSALRLWLSGASFEELHREMGLEDPTHARNLVRAAVSVLRRQFGDQP
jgi:DNA-directed RNA polymerase specialized sigma24 family protein